VVQDRGAGTDAFIPGGYRANCLYNHPNLPDGFLRTSVRQLARYARAYLNGGIADGNRILEQSTIAEMFRPYLPARTGTAQGLTWVTYDVAGQPAWGHLGSDPGVNTAVRMIPSRGIAAITFTNTNGSEPNALTDMLLREAQCLQSSRPRGGAQP
jgi:CubicO group peptidase (beta-lactamase class C family)